MTVKTRAVLNTDADANIPDNTTQQISPLKVRDRVKDLADSQVNIESDAPFWGVRVRAATIGNITVATALASGGSPSPYLDNVALAAGDLVLVKDQTSAAENGIYVVGPTPARHGRYSLYNDHPGTVVSVEEGTANADSLWRCSSDRASGSPDPIGSTALAFARVGRRLLTADLTIYVRTDGNDANFGFVDTAAGAKLTIQAAIDLAVSFDLSIYAITIRVADGTYTTPVILKSYIGVGPINLVGNTGTPANVLISTTSADALKADGVLGKWTAAGFKTQTATTGFGVRVINGSYLSLGAWNFGAVAAGYYQIYVDEGRVDLTASYTISGGGGAHYGLFHKGLIVVTAAITVTVSGTPAFGTAFIQCDRMSFGSLGLITFSGAATGVRYIVQNNSVAYTAAAAPATYFPGDAAGSLLDGGLLS